ncbi:MAG: glycosyltransferase family 39 protein [Chloroflexi bacterium]|nr:glycosyltransferase family 39 protein [Chloroflexota bacterium]
MITTLFLVGAALAMRLPATNVFITPDEMKWACRSVNFHRGLATGDLASTYQMGHPGVLTMWIGVPFMGIDPTQPWLDPCVESRTRDIIHEEPSAVIRGLGELVFRGRRGVAVLTSLALGGAFLLLLRLFGHPIRGQGGCGGPIGGYCIALLATLLMLLDPFFLALSRLLHVDAIQTSFVFLSLLCLALYWREKAARWPLLSGLFAGLALLNKSPTATLFVFAGLAILFKNLRQTRPGWSSVLPAIARDGLCWFGPAILIYVLLWPALWVQPWQTLANVYNTAFGYASEPHSGSNFFWGEPRPDPGWAFYPVAVAFRLTPWTALGLVLGAIAIIRQRKRSEWVSPLLLMLAFVLLYGLVMSAGQKKFDRYLLPGFPALQTVAAFGWLSLLDELGRAFRARRARAALLVLLFLLLVSVGLATILPHAPYYLTYYNPLLGGIRSAANKLLVGWGEGLDRAAAYLNTLPDSADKEVALRALPEFAPFFAGRAYKEDLYDPATTDYVVLYLNEIQRGRCEELLERYYGRQEPLHVVSLQGQEYVWIYENRSEEAPLAYISSQANPATDAILVNKPSLLAERYRGPLPVLTADPSWSSEELAQFLEKAASRYGRIWYVKYRLPGEAPKAHPDRLDIAWAAHTFALEEASFTDIDVSLWATAGHLPFDRYPRIEQQTALTFGDVLQLQSYTLHGPAAQWGRATRVTLEWRVLRQPDKYYSAYLHLRDAQGRRWGLGDVELQNDAFEPTVAWRAGDVVRTDILVRISPGTAPDFYYLFLGVYDRLADEPLAAFGPDGRRIDESAVLTLGCSDQVVAQPGVKLATLAVSSSPHASDPLAQIDVQTHIGATLTPAIELVGWNHDWGRLRFGQPFSLALIWRARTQPEADYVLELSLEDNQGRRWAEGRYPPASEIYPTGRWRPGEVIQRHYDLCVADDAPATEARLLLRLLDREGTPVGAPLTLTNLPLDGHRFAAPEVAHPQPAQVGEAIRLLGYELSTTEVRAGQVLHVILYWQAEGAISGDYKVFVHLYRADGSVAAQHDGQPMLGYYVTNAWQPGEYIRDEHPIEIGALSPGVYRLGVGMYDPAQGNARLPLAVDGQRQPDDRLLLATTITIASAR